jgi:hypothetical protein
MKRRSLETRFWKDSYIQSLSVEGKLLFNYLLTNEYVSIIFIYELPDNYISLETGIAVKKIQELKDQFQKDGKFLFKDNWIKIVNAEKFEHYEGETNKIAKRNLLKLISHDIIQYFDTPIHTPQTPPTIPPRGVLVTNNQQPVINNTSKYSKDYMENTAPKEFSSIKDLGDKEFDEISEKYQVPKSFVLSKLDDLTNWHEMKPQKNRYDNYYRALCDWVKRDALKVKQGGSNGKFVIADIQPD